MPNNYSLEQIVKSRRSVRTYNSRPVSTELKEEIKAYFNNLSNPFAAEVRFTMLELETVSNSGKLGTYGMIQGARNFIGASVAEGEFSLEALGYEFEKLILFITSLGLGTCWLGGTFTRGQFAQAMKIQQGDLLPAISPLGYAANNRRITESIVRTFISADHRKPWRELFFKDDFSIPLLEAEAGDYAFPLQMLRLSPSASNKQPWKIIQQGNTVHFYENKTPGYGDGLGFDIQRIDLGIAACHFHLAALERNLKGEFNKLTPPEGSVPENTCYEFSWVQE
jgi:hypothetical protein